MAKDNFMVNPSDPTLQKVKDLMGEEITIDDLRDLKEEEVFRLKNEQFRFYEPNGKCEEFIAKVGNNNFITLFSAANGIGKTAAGTNIVAHIVWGKESENKYFNHPLYKDWPYPKRGRIVSDPKNIVSNLIPALKEWLPEGRYTAVKGDKHYESIWKSDTGWEWDIMSYEQEAKEFESSTLGFAWFDEPPPEAIFKATVARMRKGGIIFISATPLAGSSWMYDHIITTPDTDLTAKGQRVFVEADVEAACKQHGLRGHLEHDHIQMMIAEYTEEEKQARIYGKFQHLVGLRFKRFNREIHIIKPFNIDLRNYAVYEALDPHPRNPDMVSWIAVDKNGTKYVIDELWLKCQNGDEELAQRIKKKADQYRIVRRVADPSAFITDQHTEQSLATKLSKLGLNYIEATKNRVMSDRRIDDALAYVTIPNSTEFVKRPEIYYFDNCQRHIWEMEHLRWDEWTGKGADNKDQKEKTIDKDDHSVENVGRILFQEPVFVPMEEEVEIKSHDYDPFDH